MKSQSSMHPSLCQTKGSHEPSLLGNISQEGKKKISLSLVGKVLSTRPINGNALAETIDLIWKTNNKVDTEVIGDNIFVFHFKSIVDK